MVTPTEAWERFARNTTPRREFNAAGARTWLNWTQYPDHGPDESLLGEVTGKHLVELGSGSGDNLAHLVGLGAVGVGVDIAPSRTAGALRRWGHMPGVEFVTADAVDYLRTQPSRFDIAYSIFGAVWFTDPAILLPAVHDALRPGGLLVFSHLPCAAEFLQTDRAVSQHHLSADQWTDILNVNGFEQATGEIVAAPEADQHGTLIVDARRRSG